MEVILSLLLPCGLFECFLHACGGDPTAAIQRENRALFSPRMWRWSYQCSNSNKHKIVFSTHVEVILSCLLVVFKWKRFLHACGGDPHSATTHKNNFLFSPRMWRWSQGQRLFPWWQIVFSTYVEVILVYRLAYRHHESFLHVCGGDPETDITNRNDGKVFSTYVEVILHLRD